MIPIHLLRFHGAILRATGRIALRGVFAPKVKSEISPVHQIIAAPPAALIEHYLAWCGAADRYPNSLPAHMVSYWGLPLIAQILLQTPYALTKVLNQGVTLRINGELPRNQPLHCKAFVALQLEEQHRTRLSVTVQTGTEDSPNIAEATLHMAFIHRPRPSSSNSNSAKIQRVDDPQLNWNTLGTWSATAHDGLQFALITGDFNPIHWSSLMGKLSGLPSKILQGFGSFARTLEQLKLDQIAQVDLRFLRPVRLPSEQLLVEQTSFDEVLSAQLRLRDRHGNVYLAGTVQQRSSAT